MDKPLLHVVLWLICTKSPLIMRRAIIIEFLILFILSNHRRRSIFLIQADPASCRKQVECFICDSRENQACEDSRVFSQAQIPTRLCDDYCLKMWTRENDTITGDNKTSALRYVRRDCHKIFHYQIKKAETCYKHKKHRTDLLCLCGSDRCNSAKNSYQQRTSNLFFIVFYFLFYWCLFFLVFSFFIFFLFSHSSLVICIFVFFFIS